MLGSMCLRLCVVVCVDVSVSVVRSTGIMRGSEVRCALGSGVMCILVGGGFGGRGL